MSVLNLSKKRKQTSTVFPVPRCKETKLDTFFKKPAFSIQPSSSCSTSTSTSSLTIPVNRSMASLAQKKLLVTAHGKLRITEQTQLNQHQHEKWLQTAQTNQLFAVRTSTSQQFEWVIPPYHKARLWTEQEITNQEHQNKEEEKEQQPGSVFHARATQEQYDFITSPYFSQPLETIKRKQILVMAGAGCGKTSTFLLFAQMNPHRRILYCVLNTELASEAKQKLASLQVDHVSVHTFASLAYLFKVKKEKMVFIEQEKEWIPSVIESFKLHKKQSLFHGHCTVPTTTEMQRVLFGLREFCKDTETQISMSHFTKLHIQRNKTAEASPMQLLIWARDVWHMVQYKQCAVMYEMIQKLMFLCPEPLEQYWDIGYVDEVQDSTDATIAVFKRPAWLLLGTGDIQQTVNQWIGVKNPMIHFQPQTGFLHLFHFTESFRFSNSIAVFRNMITVLGGIHTKSHIRQLQGCSPHQTDIRPFSFYTEQTVRRWHSTQEWIKDAWGSEEVHTPKITRQPIAVISRNNEDLMKLILSDQMFQWIEHRDVDIQMQESLIQYMFELNTFLLMSEEALQEEIKHRTTIGHFSTASKIRKLVLPLSLEERRCMGLKILEVIRWRCKLDSEIRKEQNNSTMYPHEGRAVTKDATERCTLFLTTIHTSKGLERRGVILLDNITLLLFEALGLSYDDFEAKRRQGLNATLQFLRDQIKTANVRPVLDGKMCLFTVAWTRALHGQCINPVMYDLFQALCILHEELRPFQKENVLPEEKHKEPIEEEYDEEIKDNSE